MGETHALKFELAAKGVLPGQGKVHTDFDGTGISGKRLPGNAEGQRQTSQRGKKFTHFHPNPPEVVRSERPFHK